MKERMLERVADKAAMQRQHIPAASVVCDRRVVMPLYPQAANCSTRRGEMLLSLLRLYRRTNDRVDKRET